MKKGVLLLLFFGVSILEVYADQYCAYVNNTSGVYCGGVQPFCDDGYGVFRPQEERITIVLVKKTFPQFPQIQRCVPACAPCENTTAVCATSNNLPYGYMDDTDDDEVRSPWSKAWVPTGSEHAAGRVLYDPNTAQPFRVPPFEDDYLE